MAEDQSRRRAGLIFGVSAYLLWGFLPLYFKALDHVGPIEVVAHRILWSLIFLGALITLWRRWPAVRGALVNRRAMLMLVATSVLIAVNWLVYIYAVVGGHVLEGSLGYYLNPLVNILLGVVLLKERLSRLQGTATLIAAAGVVVLAAGAGSGLWVSLVLAMTFASYGFLRKIAPVDALEGLAIETVILAPLALGWVLWLQQAGSGAFVEAGWQTSILLALGGAITAIPLLLFTAAARRLPYSTMGFLQYLAPSIQFLLAVLVFGEPLTRAHALCFGAIWTALALISFDGLRTARRARIGAASAPRA